MDFSVVLARLCNSTRGHIAIITETESTYVMIESTLRFDDVDDIPGLLLLLQVVQRSIMWSRERSRRRPGNKATTVQPRLTRAFCKRISQSPGCLSTIFSNRAMLAFEFLALSIPCLIYNGSLFTPGHGNHLQLLHSYFLPYCTSRHSNRCDWWV